MKGYVTVDNGFDETKKRNFLIYTFLYSFVWMCFHFTLIFLFLIQLKSPLYVGLLLGLGNLIAFFSDSPIGVIQRYFAPKKLFLTGAYFMLFVSIIFVYLIYQTNALELDSLSFEFSVEASKILFGSLFNVILLLLSVTMYGIIKELSDVTSYSYIMNNSNPSEYSTLFSKKNIYSGAGSLVGLITSGIILALNTLVAVIILTIFIIIFIIFINKFFDKADGDKSFYGLNILKLITNYKTSVILNKKDYIEKTKNLKVLFLKPFKIKDSIDFDYILETTGKDLKNFFKILFEAPYNFRLLTVGAIFALFGFWDTFVTSFLIDFINGILNQNGEELRAYKLQNILTAYMFIAVLAIPAYSAQIPFINLGKKIGNYKVLITGSIISGISIMLFGFYTSLLVIFALGIINSLGYAASMPISQGEFSIEYNNTYAEKMKLDTIDANASSAPIKMVSNLANVGGFVIGGFLIQMLGYTGTFIIFGMSLIIVSIISIFKQIDEIEDIVEDDKIKKVNKKNES